MADPTISLTYIAQHAMVAFFGGITHAINKHRNGQSKTFMDFILLTIMSSFFGVLFGFLGIHFFPNSEYLTMALAGTGGWLGVESMGFILEVIKNKFQK